MSGQDEAVERLARLLAGIYGRGRGFDGVLTAEQAAYRNDARAIAKHLLERPDDAAALLGGEVRYTVNGVRFPDGTVQEFDREVFAECVADDAGGTVVTATMTRGPWRAAAYGDAPSA